MAQQYAAKQPQGFKNHIEKVAIVGAGGQIGSWMTEALLKTGKHHVTAITRQDSSTKLPQGVQVKKVNYEDTSSLVEALRGHDCFIITMSVMAPPGSSNKLIEAAAAAGIPWILPNEYGIDHTVSQLANDTFIGEAILGARKQIEELGKSSYIGFSCGFWYEYSLAAGPWSYGFDFNDRKVTFYDDGKTKLNTSTFAQVGRGIASLLSLKILPDNENDKSPFLSQFRNKTVYVSSFCVSQRDMLDSILRVTRGKEGDWQIEHEPVKERYTKGKELFQQGKRIGFGRMLYARPFFPDNAGNFELTRGLQNEILGLPKEDFDEATARALKRHEENGPLSME